MIKIENKIIDEISEYSCIDIFNHEIIITNCIIRKLDLDSLCLQKSVQIKNNFIQEFKIYSTWFKAGAIIKNNIFTNEIDYQMGGHNMNPIEIISNIFMGHFAFFDCQFEDQLIIKDNIFRCGSDLLYKENKGFDNIFKKGYIIKNNIGDLDVINQKL